MDLFKNKQNEAAQIMSERLAAMIAEKLVRFKYRIASAMNKWFNAYSTNHKKWIVFSVGLLVSMILITGVCGTYYTIPLQTAHNYSAAHIGMPSEIPHRKSNNNQITDSLTIKIKSWKQQQ
jgi:hypothetical protein